MTAAVHGPVHQVDLCVLTPTRRAILALLGEEHTAGEVARHFPLKSRTAVSQHLTVLVVAQLVTYRRDGQRRWYRADRWALRQLFLDAWAELVP